eukprot:5075895-Prorocentrum_lima.AAC.1
MHAHKIALRAKNREGIWKRHTMGLLSNLPTNAFAPMKRVYYPSNFVLEEPSQFYKCPAWRALASSTREKSH